MDTQEDLNASTSVAKIESPSDDLMDSGIPIAQTAVDETLSADNHGLLLSTYTGREERYLTEYHLERVWRPADWLPYPSYLISKAIEEEEIPLWAWSYAMILLAVFAVVGFFVVHKML